MFLHGELCHSISWTNILHCTCAAWFAYHPLINMDIGLFIPLYCLSTEIQINIVENKQNWFIWSFLGFPCVLKFSQQQSVFIAFNFKRVCNYVCCGLNVECQTKAHVLEHLVSCWWCCSWRLCKLLAMGPSWWIWIGWGLESYRQALHSV